MIRLAPGTYGSAVSIMPQMTIASEATEAQKVHDAVLPEVAARGYSADAQFAIRLALDEAIANAMYHGNCHDPRKTIRINWEIGEDAVRIQVRDEGCGFEPHRVPDPTLQENLEKPNGRGIMLMNAYMSEVRFNNPGNCVTIVKRRDCKRPFPASE